MSNKHFRKSEEGSILLGALAIALLIGIFSAVIASQIKDTSDLSQIPRIRAAMAQVELQMRALAMSPSSYTCTADGPTTCDYKATAFAALKTVLPNGTIDVTHNYNRADARFTGTVAFNGTGPGAQLLLKSRSIDLEIPSEILQDPTFVCPASRPIFAGYDPGTNSITKGKPICKPLPTTVCATGQYVSSITPNTLAPNCEDAGRAVSCPADQYLETFEWNGGSTINFTCAPRKDPFADMGWTVTPSIDYVYSAQDADTPDPAPAALPPPQIVTWTAPTTEPASACYAPPSVDCVGSFGACSATCGGGTQTYGISTYASNGGLACPYTNGQRIACNSLPCPSPPTPSGCYNSVTAWFSYAANCSTPENILVTCPTGQGIATPELGSVAAPYRCGAPPSPSAWAAAECRICTPSPVPASTCNWVPGSSNANVQPPNCQGGIPMDASDVGPDPGRCSSTANGLTTRCYDGTLGTNYTCTCAPTAPPNPAPGFCTGVGETKRGQFYADVGTCEVAGPSVCAGSGETFTTCGDNPFQACCQGAAPAVPCYTIRHPSTWGGSPATEICFSRSAPDEVVNRGEEVTIQADVCRNASTGLMTAVSANGGCQGFLTISCDAAGNWTKTQETCEVQ